MKNYIKLKIIILMKKNKLNKKIKKLKDELDDKEFIIIDLKDDVSDLKKKVIN